MTQNIKNDLNQLFSDWLLSNVEEFDYFPYDYNKTGIWKKDQNNDMFNEGDYFKDIIKYSVAGNSFRYRTNKLINPEFSFVDYKLRKEKKNIFQKGFDFISFRIVKTKKRIIREPKIESKRAEIEIELR